MKKSDDKKSNKFDFSSTIDKIKASMKKDEKRASQFGLGNTLAPTSKDPKDYVVMPDWWKEHFGVLGIEVGKIVQIAGDADTGKTSLALEAMLRAQQQGFGVIYVETERKTGEKDLILKGIDPDGVMSVSTGVTEEAFDDAFKCWDGFFKDYPDEKLLFVFDSYGNTISMRDTAIDMTKQEQKPGGTAKTNRAGINRMVAQLQRGDSVAILIVNYTYANIGFKGQTNAGGKALNFFSTLILQSKRIGWIDVTSRGVKVRAGAKVRWNTYKNHYAKTLLDGEGKQILLPTRIDLSITADGFKVLEPGDEKEEKEEE